MKNKKADIKADTTTTIAGPTSLTAMEPLLISENAIARNGLTDLAIELAAKSAGFKRSLPAAIQTSLAKIVRAMNCYYSNLIEGHNTHPIEIEQALQGHYSDNQKKRNLQLEAIAHITVQEWIDNNGIIGSPFARESLCEIHRRFYKLLPEDLLWVENPTNKKRIKVIPGELRKHSVAVGNHLAANPTELPQFLSRFEAVYSKLGKAEIILSLAAAHHRLLWIHPFLDGNGRVARLMSHATILNTLNTGGMWSISRGLARNANEYKMHLANCDLSRRNDLDGRGNLSEEALVNFTRFFLETCLDQINFMEQLMQPDLLRTRILLWAQEEVQLNKLPPQSIQILEAILYRGELSRSEISALLNVSDRHARRLTSILLDQGIFISDTPKSPLKLAFPATLANRWMPGLFPA